MFPSPLVLTTSNTSTQPHSSQKPILSSPYPLPYIHSILSNMSNHIPSLPAHLCTIITFISHHSPMVFSQFFSESVKNPIFLKKPSFYHFSLFSLKFIKSSNPASPWILTGLAIFSKILKFHPHGF